MNWEQRVLEIRDEWEDRFWAFVTASASAGGCADWHGSRTPEGHGMFYVAGRGFQARRLAWALHHGECPPPYLQRTCDNPGCVLHTHMDPDAERAPTRGRPVHGPFGEFSTVVAAADAIAVNRKTIRRWCVNGIDGWGYVGA